mgnify:CR=1 FL=1|tara:strand:- start:181 stop:615 length:435 start_codon:yes stop_codon:yes gene_type:complete
MNFDKIKQMVLQDCEIDETQLDTESLRLPQLHNKYLNIYLDTKLILERKQNEFNRLRRLKWEYYTGKMDAEVLEHMGWEPFDLKILKQDIAIYMDGDDDLITLQEQVRYYKEMCAYLDATVKEVTYRHNKIRNAIDWKKFLGGQ